MNPDFYQLLVYTQILNECAVAKIVKSSLDIIWSSLLVISWYFTIFPAVRSDQLIMSAVFEVNSCRIWKNNNELVSRRLKLGPFFLMIMICLQTITLHKYLHLYKKLKQFSYRKFFFLLANDKNDLMIKFTFINVFIFHLSGVNFPAKSVVTTNNDYQIKSTSRTIDVATPESYIYVF